MRLQLNSKGIELTEDLKEHIKRRVRFALGRFAGKLRTVSVRLSDNNGPRGGVDQCCLVVLQLGRQRSILVRERQDSAQSAVALAVERAGRACGRALAVRTI